MTWVLIGMSGVVRGKCTSIKAAVRDELSSSPACPKTGAMEAFLIAVAMGCVSLLYATAGQAGGTAFLAVMAFAAFPAEEMRGTALLLNIVAAGYATWRLKRKSAIDLKILLPLTIPSLFTAFAGGLIALRESLYFVLTGWLMVAAAMLMMFRRTADAIDTKPIRPIAAAATGAAAGIISGLTGVGGGVFLAPSLIALQWTSPRGAAAISPPFILCNSIAGIIGILLAGQSIAPGALIYSTGAIVGAIIGTTIAQRWMSERTTRYVLATILAFAGVRLVLR